MVEPLLDFAIPMRSEPFDVECVSRGESARPGGVYEEVELCSDTPAEAHEEPAPAPAPAPLKIAGILEFVGFK